MKSYLSYTMDLDHIWYISSNSGKEEYGALTSQKKLKKCKRPQSCTEHKLVYTMKNMTFSSETFLTRTSRPLALTIGHGSQLNFVHVRVYLREDVDWREQTHVVH